MNLLRKETPNENISEEKSIDLSGNNSDLI